MLSEVREIGLEIKDLQMGNKENEIESYEEMSTIESEIGQDRKSMISWKLYKNSNLHN